MDNFLVWSKDGSNSVVQQSIQYSDNHSEKKKKSLSVGNVMGQYPFLTGEGNQLLKTAMWFIVVKAFSGCRWKWQTRI